MEIRVLGPLGVRTSAGAIRMGTPKQQTVLALLAVNAGRVVGVDELVDELWPESPPASAVENARGYAANLRRLFESVDPGDQRVVRQSTGYVLRAATDELDLLAFLDECDRARVAMARRDLPSAAGLLATAQARWRGRMLAGVRCGPALRARCATVEEEQLILVEDLAEIELALGNPGNAAVALREHVHLHPLRERGHALLIRAVYLTGDVAGALAAYATARANLVGELGVEPGPELQNIHAAVLNRDLGAGRLAPGDAPALSMTGMPTPRELPPDIATFVGRESELGRILAILLPRQSQHPRPTVIAMHGRGGVGKSALAVRAAHLAADRFSDGQLYVDLLGATPGLRPMAPVDALRRLLRSLGTPQDEIPSDEAGASARFRTATVQTELLLVLDNAMDTRQVLPLLPASGSCGVLVTARQPLVALDAELRLDTPVLSRAEGTRLLRRLVDDTRVEESVAGRVVDLCEGLPLAVRVAAGRLIGRPDLSLDEVAERLADRRRRLDELEGREGGGVRSSIRVGYESIVVEGDRANETAARAFRALGLLNIHDVDALVVAAMLDEPPELVRAALDRLVTEQLLVALPHGRFRLHDLIRLVAAEEAQQDGATTRDERIYRAIAYYAGGLLRAESQLRPGRVPEFGTPPIPGDIVLPDFDGPAEAWTWTQREFENLLAVAIQAGGTSGCARRFALLICHSLWFSLHRKLEWRSAERIGPILLDTARHSRDVNMEGWASLLLGQDAAEQGDLNLAMSHFRNAHTLLGDTDDKDGVVRVLNALGIASAIRGDTAAARDYYDSALAIAQTANMTPSVGVVLHNLINLHLMLGEWSEAENAVERRLALGRSLGDVNAVGGALGLRAVVHCQRGDPRKALADADEALTRLRIIGDRRRECFVLVVGAEAHLRCGDTTAALDMIQTAMDVAQRSDYAYGTAAALRLRAKALASAGDDGAATEVRAEADAAYANLRAPRDRVFEMLIAEST